MTAYPQFQPGQLVRDVFANTYTVERQEGYCVFLEGCSGHVHPAKLFLRGDGLQPPSTVRAT